MASNDDLFGLFEKLVAHQDDENHELFFGTITATIKCSEQQQPEDGEDVERDGGKSFLKKLVPRFRRSMNVVQDVGDDSLIVKHYTEHGDGSYMKFYYQTKIMEAVDSAVQMSPVISATTPEEAKFVKVVCSKCGSGESRLKSETEHYVVLVDSQLTTVQKDGLDRPDVKSLVTIFIQPDVEDHKPNVAIYFPVIEKGKKYNYYFVPQDSPQAQSQVMLKKVSVDHLTAAQIDDENGRHLNFTPTYYNPGSPPSLEATDMGGATPMNGSYCEDEGKKSGNGAVNFSIIPDLTSLTLSSDVEKD